MRALVVSRGSTVVALGVADLVGVSKEAVASIRNEVSKQTAIPPGQILVTVRHTPGDPGIKDSDGDFFVRTAVETIVRAW